MMDDDKTKDQLLKELVELRQRIDELDSSKTERQRAKEALRQSEQRYRLLLDAVTDYIYTVKVEAGRPVETFHSPACVTVTGYTSAEYEADPYLWHRMIYEKDRQQATEQVAKLLHSGKAVPPLEHRLIHKDGSLRWVRNTFVPNYDEKGHLIGYDGLVSDITKQKLVDEALQDARAKLEIRVEERTAELAEINEQLQFEIAERKQIETQLKAALKEKETLLQEVHHRVKNNLQIISSLLKLQADSEQGEQITNILWESRNRVHSMALVHEKLYRPPDLTRVDFAEYVQDLVTYLFRAYNIHGRRVSFKVEAADIDLAIETAIPCGLIINELVSNALKHAFPTGGAGEIRVALTSSKDKFTLTVQDNGIGLPADLDIQTVESMGLRLVILLVKQLRGIIELDHQAGTTFKISLTELAYSKRV